MNDRVFLDTNGGTQVLQELSPSLGSSPRAWLRKTCSLPCADCETGQTTWIREPEPGDTALKGC